MVSFCELLKAVNLEFPRELSLKDGEKLVRSILYIPPEGEEKGDEEIDSISDAVNFNEGGGYAERILNEMLHLLDDNLGKKYRRVSFELYGNKRGWRRNKWDEMLTPGLCYVYYCRNCNLQTHTRVDSPLQIQLFLSFMHTELDQVQPVTVTVHPETPRTIPVRIAVMSHCTISRSWNVLTKHLSKVLLSTPCPTRT